VTSDDGLAKDSEKLFQALQANGDHGARIVHLATDHSYSGQRIALEQAVLQALASLPPR
jgi:hypothetical protein